ncbi:trafficking protein particle complex subunit 4 [Cavenderia fasciculata]|uniref:Trafficking protein particle complex subunit n=1 Tax=Cavenderia fasciculata TaxID=261658 RepID=F4Q9M5_CACFS|nr:trafficking protein particle complex subunit 4 [Cavenderia fasciculata]EGG15394.1 trafficking protein particle complex subunit 4 [Cavenderia fasciculata]|eukprot:XP_004354136.1 trafficking protein particle complex subunit 4 [Cavenderia fasciculata]
MIITSCRNINVDDRDENLAFAVNVKVMAIYSLYILNKAGTLIFQNDYVGSVEKLSHNAYISLGSMFHGLHAIASNLSPTGSSSGIETIETEAFKLQCFQTHTGMKFYTISDPNHPNLDEILHNIYELYTDYVLKNPFYELEMSIRCDLFDDKLNRLLKGTTAD